MRILAAFASLAVLLAVPRPASAQAPTLHEVATHVAPGDQVSVLDRSGKTAFGRLDKVTNEEIVVRGEANTIVIPAGDVRRVSVPRHGKRNGFLIGAGVGVFMGVVATRFGVEGPGAQTAMVVTSAGLYGVIGLGLGALWPHERVIYRVPDQAAAPVKSSAHDVPAHALGIRLSLRW